MSHETEALADALLVDLLGGSFKGPVDEHGTAYDVFARNKAPETTVEAFGAVVAHGEDFSGRDDEVAILNVVGEFVGPAGCDLVVWTGRDGGKVVAVGVEGVLRVVVGDGHSGVGLVLRDTVEIDDAVAEADVVARNADGALDEEEVRLAGFEEDDDVAAMDVAVEGEGRPLAGGAREMRSTRTWSPMSSVLTMEAEGISKFWKMKVMTKRPIARTVQMEARDSSGVSVRSCSVVSRSLASVSIVLVKTVLHGAASSVSPMEDGFERDMDWGVVQFH